MIDHYKVLKVSPDATQETIRAQYLFLLQAFHPDKFAGAGRESHLAQAEAETKKLNLAYEVLGQPARRREFDRQREAEMRRSHNASGAASRQPPPPPPPPRTSTTRTPPPPPPRSSYRWNVKRTVVLAVIAIASSVLVEGHWWTDKRKNDTASSAKGGDTDPVAKLATMTPAQAYSYGYGQIQPQFDGMLTAVRDDLYPGSATNQMRRQGGGIELTPANVAEEMRKACAEVEQDQEVKAELRGKAARAGATNEVLESYFRGRLAGVSALNSPRHEPEPAEALSQAAPSSPSPPLENTRSSPVRSAEVPPLRDLIVQRHEGAEDDNGNVDGIWLACADNSFSPEHLCNHDSRTGQVSFSPDEQCIIVTDGGGPGSSMGTELRAFHCDTQNHYTEIPDAGVALAATRAALRGKHVPDSVKLGHVYAEVEGWSLDGKILKLTVWGHGPGYPGGGVLEATPVDFDMATAWANYHNDGANGAENNPPQAASKAADDVRAATAARDQADAGLNEAYNHLMRAVGSVQRKQLRDEERAWIKWRDAEADRVARSSVAEGGDYHTSNLSALTGLIQQRS